MKSSVTRRSVLESALRFRETVVAQSSVNGVGLRARPGMEETFERYQEECRILRELMQALEYEPVKAAIAEFLGKDEIERFAQTPKGKLLKNWQFRVMDGEKQTGLFEDGHTDENEADYTEGRDVSAGVHSVHG